MVYDGKPLLKWMIWGHDCFRKHPSVTISVVCILCVLESLFFFWEAGVGFWNFFFQKPTKKWKCKWPSAKLVVSWNWHPPSKLAWHLKMDPCKKEIPVFKPSFLGSMLVFFGGCKCSIFGKISFYQRLYLKVLPETDGQTSWGPSYVSQPQICPQCF